MTDTTDQQAVTVAQIDIDAASSIAEILEIEDWATGAGYFSDHLVQAFARHRLASVSSASAEGRETWESIAAWCEKTFGPVTLARTAERANEEMQELLAEPDNVIEAADVCIVLSRYPGLWDAVERKMAINRARTWDVRGDGTGYHIKPGASPEPVPATNQAGDVERIACDILRALGRDREGSVTVTDVARVTPFLAALATQPATSQEGEDEDVIHDCGNLGWCQAPGYCSRHGTAPTQTPPTLSEDLREFVEALEPFAAACNITTAEDSESLYDSLAAEKLTWRDLRRARAALAQVKAL